MNDDDDRYVGGPYRSAPERAPRRSGPHVGPLQITPLRTTLGVAMLGSLLIVAYGLLARDSTQLPMLIAGGAISGVVLVVGALAGVIAAYQTAAAGRAGSALVYALAAGLTILAAAGAFAAAIILALVTRD